MGEKMKKIKKLMTNIGISSLVIIAVCPIVYMLMHSLKGTELIKHIYTNSSAEVWDRVFVRPFYINLDQYYQILFRTPKFLYLFWNSMLIVIPIVMLQTLISIFAAYGFSKMKFTGSEFLFYIYVVIMIIPFQVTVVPNYITLDRLNLIDTYGALILPGIFNTFGVFFLKQFMEGIDVCFIEEGRLAGANEIQIICSIIAPMCKSIIVSVVALLFIDYWSMVEQPITFISTQEKYPLSVYLSAITENNIEIGFACSVLYMVLPIFFILYAQDDLNDGMKISSLK